MDGCESFGAAGAEADTLPWRAMACSNSSSAVLKVHGHVSMGQFTAAMFGRQIGRQIGMRAAADVLADQEWRLRQWALAACGSRALRGWNTCLRTLEEWRLW